jgi:hypothetical protein
LESSGAFVKACPIVRQARGIILDEFDNWNVVAYPFNRFFNYGETGVDKIDWNTAQVQEKLDGSLLILYNYLGRSGEWMVATRGSIEATGNVGREPFSFQHLFWNTFHNQFEDSIGEILNPDFTYMFELVSKYNKVVVDWSDEEGQLFLIGVRNRKTFQEIRPENLKFDKIPYPGFHFRLPATWPLTSFEEVVGAANKINPMQQEGYVVCDSNFSRCKVKSPKYVAIHHLTGEFANRRILELVQLGEAQEVFSYFPGTWMERLYQEVNEKINNWVETYTGYYLTAIKQIRPDSTRKEVALIFQSTVKYPGPLFSIWDRKVATAYEYLMQQPIKRIEELIGL